MSPIDPRESPSRTARIETAYREFLEMKAEGTVDFEMYCEARPDLADGLRKMHRARIRGVSPPTISSDFASRLTRYFDGADHPPSEADRKQLERLTSDEQRYLLQGEIARGGMGAILKVWDAHLRRNLAMKVILGPEGVPAHGASTGVTARMLSRFLEEAQVTGQLDHPGVVPVHELGIDEAGQVYFTMRLVKGRDLDQIIELARGNEDGWSPTRALNTLLKVCETMAYAHSKSVVHRDLKPANIMVGRFGETYVMDWGLAKLLDGLQDSTSIVDVRFGATEHSQQISPADTQHGSVLGTPCYMAPEQARGELDAIGPHTDVYSVGCMLYQLLTGQRPYTPEDSSPTVSEVLGQVLAAPPTPVRTLAPQVAPELVAICEKAMERNIADRYPTMVQMAEDLRAFLEGRVVSAYRTGAVAEFRKYVMRNKGTVAAVAGLVVVAIAAALGFALQQQERARELSEEQQRTQRAAAAALANLDDAKRQNYVANLSAADGALRDNDIREAKRYLAECDVELRGWEWSHLDLRADVSQRVLEAHIGTITAVAFDPAGKRIASVGQDRVVRLWDAASGELLRELSGHQDEIIAVAFSADGNRVFSFGAWNDGMMRTWDAESGELASNLAMSRYAAYAVAVRPDGAKVAYTSPDNSVIVIDPLAGQIELELVGHSGTIRSLAFDHSGLRLASASEDGTVRVWDLTDGSVVHELTRDGLPVWAVAFHPDATEVVGAFQDGVIEAWNAETGEVAWAMVGHSAVVYDLAFDASGDRLASVSFDKTVRVWNALTGASEAVLQGHDQAVRCVAFAPDNERLVTGSNDRTLRLWSRHPAGVITAEAPEADSLSAVAIQDDGVVVVGSSYPGVLELRDRGTEPRVLETYEDEITSVSTHGRLIAAGFQEEACVRLFDLSRGAPPVTLRGHELSVTSVAFTPDGSRVVSGSDDETVRVWDIGTGECTQVLAGEREVTSVAVSGDGKWVAAGALDGGVRLWRVGVWGEARVFEGPGAGIFALAFDPRSHLIAAGAGDHSLRVWDVQTGHLVATLLGHDQRVRAVAFHPDGDRVVSGADDAMLRVWDLEQERTLLALRGHRGPVRAVAWRGARVVSVGDDRAMRIWEAPAP